MNSNFRNRNFQDIFTFYGQDKAFTAFWIRNVCVCACVRALVVIFCVIDIFSMYRLKHIKGMDLTPVLFYAGNSLVTCNVIFFLIFAIIPLSLTSPRYIELKIYKLEINIIY